MPKGTWTRVLVNATDGNYSAIICCPVCGGTAYLPHNVSADGVVTPSAVCPKVLAGRCTWHEFIVLDGWPP